MKAIVYRCYGPPEVLHIEEMAKPTPRTNELLLKVNATEVAKSDCEMRSFKFAVKWFWLPLRFLIGVLKPKRIVLGGYFSGIVEDVGQDVIAFKKGDEVFGSTGLKFGAYGEYVCLPDTATIVKKPRNMTFEQAAAVPLGGLNAIHFLRIANVRPGEKVLINGAGGSIGTFGVQLAKSLGAHVTAVDTGEKEEMLRRIGIDHFIDYTKQSFSESGQSYDVIFSMVAKTSFPKALAALNPKGRYLLANPRLSDMMRSRIATKSKDKVVSFAFAGESKVELSELREMIEDGKVTSVIDTVYPMDEIVTAHHRVETERRLGTIVISMTH